MRRFQVERMTNASESAQSVTTIDPVCGMTVDRDDARDRGLHVEHDGTDYFFCGKGCKLDFLDDPVPFLEPGRQRHM